jgi:hypothetical protein
MLRLSLKTLAASFLISDFYMMGMGGKSIYALTITITRPC